MAHLALVGSCCRACVMSCGVLVGRNMFPKDPVKMMCLSTGSPVTHCEASGIVDPLPYRVYFFAFIVLRVRW